MSGGRKLSPFELYHKVDNEGGLFEAVFGYGLRFDDIDDSTPEGYVLRGAWSVMEEIYAKEFGPAYEYVEQLLEEYQSVGQEEYGEDVE